jgi:hypothetical protein
VTPESRSHELRARLLRIETRPEESPPSVHTTSSTSDWARGNSARVSSVDNRQDALNGAEDTRSLVIRRRTNGSLKRQRSRVNPLAWRSMYRQSRESALSGDRDRRGTVTQVMTRSPALWGWFLDTITSTRRSVAMNP